MKIFSCIILSHCEAPDFEYEIDADTKDEAVKKIISKCKYCEDAPGYDLIFDNTVEINEKGFPVTPEVL